MKSNGIVDMIGIKIYDHRFATFRASGGGGGGDNKDARELQNYVGSESWHFFLLLKIPQ